MYGFRAVILLLLSFFGALKYAGKEVRGMGTSNKKDHLGVVEKLISIAKGIAYILVAIKSLLNS